MFNPSEWVELDHKEQITRQRSFLIFWIHSNIFENHQRYQGVAFKTGNEMIHWLEEKK